MAGLIDADGGLDFGTGLDEDFADAIELAANQTALPPAPWHLVGLSDADVYAFCGGLIKDIREGVDARDHFADVLDGNRLQQIGTA